MKIIRKKQQTRINKQRYKKSEIQNKLEYTNKDTNNHKYKTDLNKQKKIQTIRKNNKLE